MIIILLLYMFSLFLAYLFNIGQTASFVWVFISLASLWNDYRVCHFIKGKTSEKYYSSVCTTTRDIKNLFLFSLILVLCKKFNIEINNIYIVAVFFLTFVHSCINTIIHSSEERLNQMFDNQEYQDNNKPLDYYKGDYK